MLHGGKDLARNKLMELAELGLKKDLLVARKDQNYPEISKNAELLEQLSQLQDEESRYVIQIDDLKRQVAILDRPTSGLKNADLDKVNAQEKEAWAHEKAQKEL